MDQNVKCGRGGAGVCGASRLYRKWRKTRTFQMDTVQKLHIEKLSNLVYIIYTYGMVDRTDITK